MGFKPNFSDYSPLDQDVILKAPRIYYPTSFYADLFHTMGKETFPNFHTYKFAQDKIRQTVIFQMMGLPHPRTYIFFGKQQKKQILDFFQYPFVAKKARGSSRGRHVYLIRNRDDLTKYLFRGGPAYIQNYIPIDRDIRVVIIGKQVVLSYWRVLGVDPFRTNVFQGGHISFNPVPQEALELALKTASLCGWDDVGIDIVEKDGQFYVLEANMKYGIKGFAKAGINYKKLLCDLLNAGKI
ncbi:ribosomal protein S6--L-glutamate ligase [Desulfocicer vacuolatum DSM 3385]|uniref:Ribosomal protein S6--L-glutamate ligase n=1 Tax=Desulfocicer vacuolatum DSM 3385 TaxID=1121400 RepID=A0A1W2BHM2_9BACT|nr:ATP-grasp domain-containing protein [Desulfocicer vacuolatum]SMC72475.1 ribosomal protein S6--L-glutamate ligase [Desulfocicer vacuolatum DSM 3385]